MVFVAPPVPRPVLRGVLVATLVTALALAGCSGKDPPAATGPVASEAMTIVGLVQNETFAPIPGAQVSLRLTGHVATTDAGGLFTFEDLPLSPYLVDVVAAGFENATLNAEPMHNVSLSFVLYRPVIGIPEPVTAQFTGYFECAFEALIIPGSCDFILDQPGLNGTGQDPFKDRNSFVMGLGTAWSTVVVDVVFSPQAGLDGLHLTLRGRNDADQLASYGQYAQAEGTGPFTFRMEPEQTYPGSTAGAVPANLTALQLDVYPMGYAYHALCSDPVPDPAHPPAGSCPLGVGAAQNVKFDLFVTVFFVEPAPEGFTLLP